MPATHDSIAMLREFDRRIDELLKVIGDRSHMQPQDVEIARSMYTSLKRDLEEEGNRSTAIAYAAKQARCRLKAATNTHPINSYWRSILYEAQVDIRHAISCHTPPIVP
jgi:hypothetical protein